MDTLMDHEEPRLNAAKILITDQDRKNLSHHPAKKRRGTFLFPEPTGPHPRRRKNHDSSSASSCVTTTNEFTFEELQRLLFTKNDSQEITVKRPVESRQNECFWCDATKTNPNFQCPMHKHDKAVVKKTSQLPMALRSLPSEVGLCTSTIPGQECGICAKRKIPVGAWIGPYEGKFLKPKELSSTTDTSYMWEIFQNGELTGYIDGSDVKLTSWMRFIRSARHKKEQNLFAFQYLGRIFYRAFKDILPGEEMLVWYDEKYPQYLGIPWTIFDLAAAVPPGTSSRTDEVIMVSPVGKNDRPLNISTQESIFPSPPPSPLSKPSSPWKRVSTSIQEKRSPLHPSQDERLCYSKSVANLGENPVEHIQKHGNPPTITKKCKYSSCKKITSATNSCSRGKNVKSPHKAYGAQVPQRPYRSTTPVVSFRATNQQRTYAFIQGNDSGYCSSSFNKTVTMDNHIRSQNSRGQIFAHEMSKLKD